MLRAQLLLVCLAAVAGAQVPTIPPAAPDSIPSFERPNGALMRTGVLTYTLALTKPNGQTVPLGTRTVTVADAPLGGNPAWLVAEARQGTVVETTDSVWLARGDLSPQRWTSTIGRAQLGASFTRDSVFGAVDNYQGRTSFVVALPGNALLSAGMAERVVEMLPLHEGYRAAAALMLIDGGTPRMQPAEIVVERAERISVGARQVDCWRIALRVGVVEERLWVSRDGARVVRTEQAVADGVLSGVLQ